jgi:hypothetical protein
MDTRPAKTHRVPAERDAGDSECDTEGVMTGSRLPADRETQTRHVPHDNEEFVRQARAKAEVKDVPGCVGCFNPDGVMVDESVGVTCRGPDEFQWLRGGKLARRSIGLFESDAPSHSSPS